MPDPILDGVTKGFLERGLLGIICVVLAYVILKLWARYESRLEQQSEANKEALAEKDRIHREIVAEKDRQISSLNERVLAEVKNVYQHTTAITSSLEAVSKAITKGTSA